MRLLSMRFEREPLSPEAGFFEKLIVCSLTSRHGTYLTCPCLRLFGRRLFREKIGLKLGIVSRDQARGETDMDVFAGKAAPITSQR